MFHQITQNVKHCRPIEETSTSTLCMAFAYAERICPRMPSNNMASVAVAVCTSVWMSGTDDRTCSLKWSFLAAERT